MRSDRATSSGTVVTTTEREGKSSAVEEVVVSLCNRSICFYSSSTQQETTSVAPPAASSLEEEGARPPSVPRSRWLFPEEELPVLQWRNPRRCGVGLGNPHALCFMNAVLQALAYTPGVADDLLEGRHSRRCALAAAAAAARRRARSMQHPRHSSSEPRSSVANRYTGFLRSADETDAAEARAFDDDNANKSECIEKVVDGVTREAGGSRRSSSNNGVDFHSSGGAEDEASVSFCLLCKLEEQVQSIHCATPSRGGTSALPDEEQQRHCRAAEGAVRGFVRNRFSRYVKQFVWRRYREGRQEDAHEFLRYLLDALMRCNTSTSGNTGKRRGNAVVDSLRMPPEIWLTSYFGQLFGGWLQSSVCCSSCGYCSRRFDACLDLPLDLASPSPPPAAFCSSSTRGSGASGDYETAGGAVCRTRRHSNSSSSTEDGICPAAKNFASHKLSAGSDCTTSADRLCSNTVYNGGSAERQAKVQEMHATAAAAMPGCLLAGGDVNYVRPNERRRRQWALREGGSTVEKALQQFIAKEYLTGDNSYSCPQCKQKRAATKQLRVYTPPRVLVLFIKRFSVGCWGGAARGSGLFPGPSFLLKNQAPVAFPAVLNLAPYMVTSPPPERAACLRSPPDQPSYSRVAGPYNTLATGSPGGAEANMFESLKRSWQQRVQPPSTLALSAVSKDRGNSSALHEEEEEASPRSNATSNSTSTRASSSESPSLSRSPSASRLQNGPPRNDVKTGQCIDSDRESVAASIDSASVPCCATIPSENSVHSVAGNNVVQSPSGVREASTATRYGPVEPPPLYQLYAVVTHSGSSLSSGHYRCFVRAPASAPLATCGDTEADAAAAASMWLLIDDEVVQTVSETFVLQRLQHDAYLLFYSRLPTVQEQQEQLQKVAQNESSEGALYTSQRRPHPQQMEMMRHSEEPLASLKLTESERTSSSSDSSCSQSRSSISSDSDFIEPDCCESTSSSSSSACSLSSDRTDESSGSVCSTSSSTCSSLESESSKCTENAEQAVKTRKSLRLKASSSMASHANLKTLKKSTCSPRLLQAAASKTRPIYGKKIRLQRLMALRISLLRRLQKKQHVDATNTRAREPQSKEMTNVDEDKVSQGIERGGDTSDRKNLREDGEETQQSVCGTEQDCVNGQLNSSVTCGVRLLSAEEMRTRVRAASDLASQYGVAQPGAWNDGDEERNMVSDEAETHMRQVAFEHLQELQQPRRQVRCRHDREYDRGKVKKVRKKFSSKELAIGETLVLKSKGGERTALVVHQRKAFDTVVEAQKQDSTSRVRFHAKKQNCHRKQVNVHARQKRKGGLKYGRGGFGKRRPYSN